MNLRNKLTSELVEHLINEIKKEKNKIRIKNYLIEPTICYIINKIYPYIIITFIFFILIILISVSMLLIIIRSNYKK